MSIGPKAAMTTKMTKDEQTMMDDLLAGLDASTFDMSPTKSQSTQPKSQAKVERESPLKSRRSNQCDTRAQTPGTFGKSQPSSSSPLHRANRLPVKVEIEDGSGSSRNEVTEVKVKTDEELFEDLDDLCDLDFGDLSAFDEDLYEPPPPAVSLFSDWDARPSGRINLISDYQIKYPIAHPAVPRPRDGYASTPWLRCTVEFVYDGLRFGDGVIPSRGILEQMVGSSGAGSPVGKVRTTKWL